MCLFLWASMGPTWGIEKIQKFWFSIRPTPHPIWSSAGSSPAKVAMATIQAKMLSGRYRTEKLCRHWSKNKNGFCLLLSPSCSTTPEDLPNILAKKLMLFTVEYSMKVPDITHLIRTLCHPSNPTFCQFLIDCSSLPEIILAEQTSGCPVIFHLFNITRTWIYTLLRERLKLLGRWNIIWLCSTEYNLKMTFSHS